MIAYLRTPNELEDSGNVRWRDPSATFRLRISSQEPISDCAGPFRFILGRIFPRVCSHPPFWGFVCFYFSASSPLTHGWKR
jgi:hypothetical protein